MIGSRRILAVLLMAGLGLGFVACAGGDQHEDAETAPAPAAEPDGPVIQSDDFESGDTSDWETSEPSETKDSEESETKEDPGA